MGQLTLMGNRVQRTMKTAASTARLLGPAGTPVPTTLSVATGVPAVLECGRPFS
jgi:hypothetical protein